MNRQTFPAQVIVLHVKKGYEERGRHMESMLGARGIPFTYLLDGDIDDANFGEELDKYFTDEVKKRPPAASCALKHFYAYRYILGNKLPGALILEDDMLLYRRFEKIFGKCLRECEQRNITNCLISLEDSNLKFVRRSDRKKGRHLYPAKRDRFACAYYISAECARMILKYVEKHKCHLPIDIFHQELITSIGLPYYWCHPAIATQGSHCGLFPSSISERSAHRRLYRRVTWDIKRIYKHLVYFFR